MHGNEGAPRQILHDAARRPSPSTASTCGWCRSTTPTGSPPAPRNAHGVDLNRNYPYHWADLDGNYESGPAPASEPETKAMMRFLRDVARAAC